MNETISKDNADIRLPNQRPPEPAPSPSGPRPRRQIGACAPGAAPLPNARGRVAIVGFAGRFPGADNSEQFWQLLKEERSEISELPYWHLPGIAERAHLREAFACPGGFINQPTAFDADFFRISAREAEAMDPQQRLVLEQTWAAFEDAGICPQRLRGSDTGVFIGVSSADYNGLLARSEAGTHDATGNAHSIIANRISYLFDFHGPSAPIDTACSSSLVAVHRAAQSILSGDCTLAVAGGVNLCFEPMVFIGALKAGMLSPSGRCKAFAADADGYVRGEGVGVLILKDYRQALADGDRIVATIIGSAENHGGHANSLTAPNPRAQAELIKQACRGIDINSIGYIEVHGTGTRLGDPIEISGLKQAFAELGAKPQQRCYLGSVKTNIGHLESAAGIAGVIKTLLALQQGYLPKSLHSEQLNPYIDLEGSPFQVLQSGRQWPQPRDDQGQPLPRRAGVSSFGFGGANAHVLLEEVEPQSGVTEAGWAATLFPLSGRSAEALRSRVEQLIDFVQRQPQWALADLAGSLQLGREAMEYRLALQADSHESLLRQLRASEVGEGNRSTAKSAEQGLQQALQRQDRDGLLRLWREGADLDWQQLYPQARPRRLALPTYPFSREHYWIGEPGATLDTGAAQLHPLVQRNTSDLAGQRFSSRFTGNEWFFTEHQVQGVKVLPGVAYLEMARVALELSLGDETRLVGLKNIAWHQPMRHHGGELAVDIELAQQDNGEIRFDVRGATVDGPSYCSGVAWLGPAESPAALDLQAIAGATAEQHLAPERCYEIFQDMGLAYGAGFRRISALQAGNGQVLARLQAMAVEPQLGLPPGLLDSALQAALGLALLEPTAADQPRRPLLPFALDRVILGDLQLLAGPCQAWVRYSASHQPGRINKLDVDICDEQGRVALRLLGFSSRLLEPTTAPTLCMTPVWRDQPLANGAGANPAQGNYSRQLILLAGTPGVALGSLVEQCQALAGATRQVQIEPLPLGADDPVAALASLGGWLIELLRNGPADSLVQLVRVDLEQAAAPFNALLALLKTARNEGLIGAVQAIEISGSLVPQWLMDNARQDAERVCYLEARRQVAAWQETLPAPLTAAVWRTGGVYLLTGGTGGLGLLLALEIARQAQGARLILVSRSANRLAPEAKAKIAAIEALGAEVRLEALDVADPDAVSALLARCEQAFGSLNGIFHCAGVTADSPLGNKTAAGFKAVLAPKVAGLLNLDRASAHLALDCFVLFSSVSAVIGNPGQGDYALANAFMDEWALWRSAQVQAGQRQGRTLAINWPLWRNGGMRIDARREQQMFEQTGIQPLSDSAGLALLQQALADARGIVRWMVLEGDVPRIRRFIAGQEQPAPADSVAEPPETAALPQAVGAEGEALELAIRYFKQLLCKTLKRPLEKIDSDGSFERYGADSIMLAELTRQLEHSFGSLPNTLLYEHQTLRELSEYFLRQHRQALHALLLPAQAQHRTPGAGRAPVPQAPVSRRQPGRRPAQETAPALGSNRELAIIGISGRYPGAEDLDEFWRQLAAGADLISEVPDSRWPHQAYFDPSRERLDKTCCKWGGFLDGVEDFDPLFFHLSPREAPLINPNDRLFLETCWNLLESAGLTRQQVKQRYQQQVGVFVGVMYQQYQALESDLVRESLVSVSSYSAIANRVSYFFDFQGPSLAIDTMCSSSISAIHAAGAALRNGDCRLAIAGGVNLTLHPKKYIGLSAGQVLGSHAGSRSFADGDGYLPAEGVGAVLLKTLADAERDGDPILAVIKSTATNHGGHTHGFSVPSAKVQAALIESNFQRAAIDPRSISYVESAANGSALGDGIELSALNRVFNQAGVAAGSCALGSVKSNMGHAEAASGMAALSKLVLQLQHRQLLPSLVLGPLNPQLDFARSPFVLQRSLADWTQPLLEIDGVRQAMPRRACLSAFGAGGSNAHLIIEEYPQAPAPDTAEQESDAAHIVPLSAHSRGALQQALARLARHLERQPEVRLKDLAHTLQSHREAMPLRLALWVSSTGELHRVLREALERLGQGETLDTLATANLPLVFGNLDEVAPALASLLAGPGAAALGQGLMAAGDVQQLALLWTQGGEIAWQQLAQNSAARLIPLPTYAFDKKRYWLEPPTLPKAPQQELEEALVTGEGRVQVPGDPGATAAEQGRRLLADLLGMQPEELSPGKALSAYGVDSILMLQWAMQVQTRIDPGLALADLQQCQTLGDALGLLGKRAAPQASVLPAQIIGLLSGQPVRFPELQRLNQVQHGQPVFWLHGALGGCEIYQGLAQQIQRPFFGLQARGWMTDRAPLQGIQAMAAYYIQVIQSLQPHGPYDLGGYSLGGMLAYEMTRQLQELGESVSSLVMLDTPDVTGERTARLGERTPLLQTVNMSLQMSLGQAPERFAEVLIHRDEVDLALSPADYLQQLTALARQRGLASSDERLQQLVTQVTRIQQAYQVEHYRIQPLPRAAEVACYYFRNASGLWMGALEPFFSTDSQEFAAFNHADYWQEWQRQLPNFEIIEVASANHMTLLSQPEVFREIARFCTALYGATQVESALG